MRRVGIRLGAMAASLALAIAILAVTAAPASGWTGPSRINSRRAALDWCPGNASICQNASRLVTLGENTAVNMVCWAKARTTGETTNLWFYVTTGSDQGWVNADRVRNQNPNSPWCLDNATQQRRAVNASLYATGLSEYHQVSPTSTDRANYRSVYGGSDADWGPYGDWSGQCPIFVGLAWWTSKVKIRTDGGTAASIGAKYKSLGLLHTSGTSPRGSAVFWSGGSDGAGHVAISLGNSRVVSTSGYESQRLQTTDHAVSYFASPLKYMGWVSTT